MQDKVYFHLEAKAHILLLEALGRASMKNGIKHFRKRSKRTVWTLQVCQAEEDKALLMKGETQELIRAVKTTLQTNQFQY